MTRAQKAVRASRANARAAASAPPARSSRTVRIRPDTDLEDVAPAPRGLVPVQDPGFIGDDYDDSFDEDGDPVFAAEEDDADQEYDEAEDTDGGDTDGGDTDGGDTGGGEYDDEPAPVASNGRRAPRPTAPPRPTPAPAPQRQAPPQAARRAVPRPAADPDRIEPPTPRPAPIAPVPVIVPVEALDEKPAKADKPAKEKKARPSVSAVGRDVIDKVGLVVQLVALVCFLILIVHVLFVASDANANNAIVSWFDRRSNGLVGDFRNIFSAKSAKTRVFYNYGLAAVVYLLVGSIVRRVLRK